MSNQFQDIYVENIRPFPGKVYITAHAPNVYANPWLGLVNGGPITLNAQEFLHGGVVAHFNTYAHEVTLPSVADISTELGTSDVTGYVLDYVVANNSTDPLIIHLGAGMNTTSAISGAANLQIPAQSTGSFRIIGYWDGSANAMTVSRIS